MEEFMLNRILIGAAFAIAACSLAACGDYSDGSRTGHIIKLSHKGVVCKTWEGELALGSSNLMTMGPIFEFTVEDPKVLEAIKQKMNAGAQITLDYHQEMWVMPCRTENKGYYFAVGVH
jgi:hypothetical protein